MTSQLTIVLRENEVYEFSLILCIASQYYPPHPQISLQHREKQPHFYIPAPEKFFIKYIFAYRDKVQR